MGQPIEAVFEKGVFRPLQSVDLPEQHRVTLVVSKSESGVCVPKNGRQTEEEEMHQEVGYQSLPLRDCQTIRVKFRHAGDYGPLPYLIEENDDTVDEQGQP